MSQSPSVIAAATTLADWARDRRRVWSDVPLDVPIPVIPVRAPAPVTLIEEIVVVAPEVIPPEVSAPDVLTAFESYEEPVAGPSVFAIATAAVTTGLKAATTGLKARSSRS